MVNICVERAENMTYFEVLPEADAYNFSYHFLFPMTAPLPHLLPRLRPCPEIM
jgi:hypothetical protein